MSKYALFAFRGEQMCFLHVLLNAIDIHKQGYEVKVVIEGEATKLLPELYDTKNPLYKLYQEVLEKNLLEGICKACSQKFGTYDLALQKGLKILDDMANHAGMGRFTKQGYQIITF